MKFIPRKAVNKLVPFSFYKHIQQNMPDFVITNAAFSAQYLTPKTAPQGTKAQKLAFKKYDKVDENMRQFKKDNFLNIDGEYYLVINTVVKRDRLMAYAEDKTREDIQYEMTNPGQLLLQVLVDGKNILTPNITDYEFDRLGELEYRDDDVKIYVNIANTDTYEMDLILIK